ncbi:OV-16 antigen isoform X2 [Bemisia tabaci]|uniref:OV-16 antigen isoform X2 n=1 Tax=Bemisia tabaci TaxID=7038 RepID=UPI003B27EE84
MVFFVYCGKYTHTSLNIHLIYTFPGFSSTSHFIGDLDHSEHTHKRRFFPTSGTKIKMYLCTRVPHYVFILNFGISLISAVTKEVKQQLTQHRILPDVIEVFPTSVIHVEYEQQALKIAELLKLDQVKTKPSVSWPAAPDALYTLIMTDADYPAPSAPNRTEFLHWMIINMEGSTLDVSNAETTVEYLAPLANSTPEPSLREPISALLHSLKNINLVTPLQ